MLGSPFEAEDAVQETLIRAWRAPTGSRAGPRCAPGCTGSPPTSASTCSRAASGARGRWTSGRPRRRPIENLNGAPEVTWIAADARTPARPPRSSSAESIRLAFVAALQHLPPRQRAVLILCEVLRWQATEVAELLETSVASVNSALQRARATLEAAAVSVDDPAPELGDDERELLDRYVDAFEATTSTR